MMITMEDKMKDIEDREITLKADNDKLKSEMEVYIPFLIPWIDPTLLHWGKTDERPLIVERDLRYTRINLPTNRQQVVFTLLVPSCQHVWNNLLKTCNKLVGIIRLVTRLFQQARYSHDITILLQPCVINLVTLLLRIS
jgi:hypothetical protein